MSSSEPAKAQQRIITAATELFSHMGYNGVSTKNIAELAEVAESSIFRHYRSKRDLFEATLDAEFGKVRLRADLISKVAMATDAHAAIVALFQLILESVLQQPALVRLVHFSVLEFGADLDELYRRHVKDGLQVAGNYLARWPELTETDRFDTRITILSFISTVFALQQFYPLLAGEKLSQQSLERAARRCAELWHAALRRNLANSVSHIAQSAHA